MHGVTRKQHIKDCSRYSRLEKKLIFQTCLFRTFPKLPKDLIELQCLSCPFIESLPKLPESLKILKCIDCDNLGEILEFPPNLEICEYTMTNHLNSLPEFPNTLKILNVSGNANLEFIPDFPKSLEYLDVHWCHKKLKFLPAVKNLKNLKYLDLSITYLDFFPDLPENLQVLICYNSRFKSLPKLPKKLEKLSIDGSIIKLPELPETLITLFTASSTLRNTIQYFLTLLKEENEVNCLYVQSQLENKGFLNACQAHKIDLHPVFEKLQICLEKRQIDLSQELGINYPKDLAKLISSYDTGSNFKSGFKRSRKGSKRIKKKSR